jgi:hypothetical protein
MDVREDGWRIIGRCLTYSFYHGCMLEYGVNGVKLEQEEQVRGCAAVFVGFRKKNINWKKKDVSRAFVHPFVRGEEHGAEGEN